MAKKVPPNPTKRALIMLAPNAASLFFDKCTQGVGVNEVVTMRNPRDEQIMGTNVTRSIMTRNTMATEVKRACRLAAVCERRLHNKADFAISSILCAALRGMYRVFAGDAVSTRTVRMTRASLALSHSTSRTIRVRCFSPSRTGSKSSALGRGWHKMVRAMEWNLLRTLSSIPEPPSSIASMSSSSSSPSAPSSPRPV